VKRGDIATVALQGSYGKPRPALVVQADLFVAHPSVTLLPLTSECRQLPLFRVAVVPTRANGLTKPSEIMVDKCVTVGRDKVGRVIGRLEGERMLEVNRALAVFLGLA
jgi:mRNA interferase MazF